MRSVGGRRVLRISLSLLGLGIFALVLYVGGAEAWRQVLRADLLWVGVAFASTALLTYVSAARWGLIANAIHGTRLCSTRAYYHYLMVGKTLGLVLPEAVGVYTAGPLAMKLDGHSSFKLAFGTLFVDKLFDLGLSGVLLIPTVGYVLRLIGLEACAALFCLFLLLPAAALAGWYEPLVSWGFRLRTLLLSRSERLPLLSRFLRGRAGETLLALEPGHVPSREVTLAAYGITVLRYLLMTLRFASVAAALRVAVPPLLVFVGIPIAQLGLLLAVTPGAIGALEAGWLGVLLLAGLPRHDIATFLIGQRAALFVFIFVLGLSSYVGSLVFPFRRQHA